MDVAIRLERARPGQALQGSLGGVLTEQDCRLLPSEQTGDRSYLAGCSWQSGKHFASDGKEYLRGGLLREHDLSSRAFQVGLDPQTTGGDLQGADLTSAPQLEGNPE